MGAAAQEPLRLWGARPAHALEAELEAAGGAAIINLASKEYWRVLEPHLKPGKRVIEIDLREDGPTGLRFNTFAAKRARGMMARYICEHRLDDPEALKAFNSDGYAFDPNSSDERRWRFSRS